MDVSQPPPALPNDLRINMVEVASARGHAWLLIAALFAPPSLDFVRRLRDGRFAAELTASTAWVGSGQGTNTLTAIQATFSNYAKTVALRSNQTVQAQLRLDWDALAASVDDPATTFGTLADAFGEQVALASEEAKSWEHSEIEHAKTLRHRQQIVLENTLVSLFPPICETFRNKATHPIYQAAGWLGLCQISLESGRGFITD